MYIQLFILAISKSSEPLFDTPTTVAICALFVSIVSIVFGVMYNRKSLELTEKHNMLSVMPQINLLHASSRNENTSELIIKNNGLGPAIIESVYYYFNDKEYRSFDQLLNNVDRKMYKQLDFDNSPCSQVFNHSLSAGTTFKLFHLKFKDSMPFDEWIPITRNSRVVIKYKSMYNDTLIAQGPVNPYKKKSE